LYHGVEIKQTKSEEFKIDMESLGYSVISKEVKWTPVTLEKQIILKRLWKFIWYFR